MKKLLYAFLLVPCMTQLTNAMIGSDTGGAVRQRAGFEGGQTVPAYRGLGSEKAYLEAQGTLQTEE